MDYIIGAGAILETGDNGSITPATLHAHVGPALAPRVGVAAVDFDSASAGALRRLLVLIQGSNPRAIRTDVTAQLRERRECSLADVLRILAHAGGTAEVHLFAHWLPDEATCSQLAADGITVVSHPLETIDAAALITAQRREVWPARAA